MVHLTVPRWIRINKVMSTDDSIRMIQAESNRLSLECNTLTLRNEDTTSLDR